MDNYKLIETIEEVFKTFPNKWYKRIDFIDILKLGNEMNGTVNNILGSMVSRGLLETTIRVAPNNWNEYGIIYYRSL